MKHVKVPWRTDCPAVDSKIWGIDENLHFFESIHLLRSVDFDVRNIFRRKSDIEEFLLVCFGVGHDFVPSSRPACGFLALLEIEVVKSIR